MAAILRAAEVLDGHMHVVGGKGVNLARLQRSGQPVPPWFALAATVFLDTVAAAGLDARIRARLVDLAADDEEAWRKAGQEIRQWLLDLELPAELQDGIIEAHAEIAGEVDYVAVRSSAVGEDSATDSFAGLHDSFLFVRGRRPLIEAVRRVWASAYNDRALAYRRARGLAPGQVAVGVLVQRMVDAETAGVVFTANPTTGDVHQVVVSSLYGAGEGLVSAGLDADTFTFDKETLEIDQQVVSKVEELVVDREAGGLRSQPVAEELRDSPSLEQARLRAVVGACLAIERDYRRPMDVEFCIDHEGGLWILQARPVTTVEEYGPAAGNRLVWDNSNIIESYSGVTTPMTFSFIRHAYTIVYHCFSEVMGIRPQVVRANHDTFSNMLGLFRGQVYYNLRNWYRLIRLFPGYRLNARFMESMMGVRESSSFADDAPPEPSLARRLLVELPALARLLLRSASNFLRIRRVVSGFENHFRESFRRWSAMDLAAMPPHRLRELYLEMEEALLWRWKAPIINDFYVMIFYGVLKKLCNIWCGDESGSLQNDLICGEGGIESTKPTEMLLVLAGRVVQSAELEQLFRTEKPERLAELIPSDPRYAAFAAEVSRYLKLYGFRCVNELKLEEHSLKDRPAFLYQVISNYVAMEDRSILDVEAGRQREQVIRRQAEARAMAAIGASWSPLPRRWIFRRVLAAARLGVKNRENMRFARTRIYGLLRELLRAIGDQLAAEGLLEDRDDIFFLTLDEVWDFIKGTAVTTDLRGLAALRKQEFEAFRDQPERNPDDRFVTYGMAYHRNRFRAREAAAAVAEDGSLSGIGCCPGVVTGEVKVLRSPSEDASLSGEILVAERTDPGWVPLYPAVSGLLIERGSVLSHSAIVAREMGIPTIVGIVGLTAAVTSGDRVRIDGAAGTVEILDQGSETDSE